VSGSRGGVGEPVLRRLSADAPSVGGVAQALDGGGHRRVRPSIHSEGLDLRLGRALRRSALPAGDRGGRQRGEGDDDDGHRRGAPEAA
jgi:hypothetical protein